MGDIKPILKDITTTKIHHFAAEPRGLEAHEIKDFSLYKRISLILCLIYSAQVTARDSLIEMFLRKMRSVNNDAKKELELIKQRIQETQERLVGVLTNVLKVFVDEQENVAGQKDFHPENYSSGISGADYMKQAQLLSLPVDNLTFLSSYFLIN